MPVPRSARSPASPATGFTLARVGGIEIRLDVSVLVIFTIVVVSLGIGLLAQWHPDWSAALRWTVAVAAGVAFFTSLVLHELAHSLVAQARGIRVPRITLFLFGGVSELSSEPRTPWEEFAIAIVGPLTSLILGIVGTVAGAALAGPDFGESLTRDPQTAYAALSPWATLLLWLGPVNVALGVFNMVPGFPMDGGRVLRSIVWAVTGDLSRATQIATSAGRLVAVGLIALGGYRVVVGQFDGLWLILIGWFLYGSAQRSYQQQVIQHVLRGVLVRDVMQTGLMATPADVTVDEFVHGTVLHSKQLVWPVLDGAGHTVGVVTVDDLQRVPPEDRRQQRVGQLARPLGDEELGPGELVTDALRLFGTDPRPRVVVHGGQVVGSFGTEDIGRWLAVTERASG